MCLSVCGAPHCKYYWPPQIFRPFAIPDVRAVIEGHLIEQVLLLNVVKLPKCHINIFCSFFHVMKSQNQFRRSLGPFLLSNFYLEMRRLVSLLAPYKVHKPPKNLYLLTWAGNKMSYCYFLFIFSWYVKPNLISEKFEAIFVKHFLPWNLTPSKHCSSQIGPETPPKILRSEFSMPIPN